MDHNTIWENTVQQLREACRGYDSVWMMRNRVFDTFSLLTSLMNLSVGHGKSYLRSMNYFSPDGEIKPAASSFCAARKKLPSYILNEVRDDLLSYWDELYGLDDDWFGHTPYIVDGSKVILPPELGKDNFRKQKGVFCPHGLLSTLFRAKDKMIFGQSLTSHWNERAVAHDFLEKLSPKDLVIYDRGYFSANLLLDHIQRNIPVVFRMTSDQSLKEVVEFFKGDLNDEVVCVSFSSTTKTKVWKMFPGLNLNGVKLRLVKYEIEGEKFLLATTVMDLKIKTRDFVELYKKRWMIEEYLKNSKITMEAETFHSKSVNGVEQEILASGLIWNLAVFTERMIPESLKKISNLYKNIPLPNELPSSRA